ncbi:aminoacetone oxidase family FAD-binding enzyme [bacterium]|nr:aminoacetone oxidase family FAD-binding enzyme [bacterium]
MKKDCVIIGGGAAGLFCALEAAKRGRKVTVLEHNNQVGRKIEISGGGRCNFTNLYASPEHYISQNPRFCISALNQYTPHNFIGWIERHAISYHEKKLGQLFCDDANNPIGNLLREECLRAGVAIVLNCQVKTAEKQDAFRLRTTHGEINAVSLVVATGGVSLPKIGATDIGYRIAERFGLPVTPIREGLVPFVFSKTDAKTWKGLRGISIPVTIQKGKNEFEENLLFTHKGLSGPAVLQISNYWEPGHTVHINLLPGRDIKYLLEKNRSRSILLGNFLADHLPKKFAQTWCEAIFPNKPLKQYTPRELATIAETLERWPVSPDRTEGFHKAEVTLGGVDTRELNPKTMECRTIPHLYFIGEVVDVTGWLGGYNFQWAWSSAYAAGQALK